MSKSFSFLARYFRSRPIVKKNPRLGDRGSRLGLETLEDRLPPGDLLGVLLPSLLKITGSQTSSAPAKHTPAPAAPAAHTGSSSSSPGALLTTTKTNTPKVAAALPPTQNMAKPPANQEDLSTGITSRSGPSSTMDSSLGNPLLGSPGTTGGQGPLNPTTGLSNPWSGSIQGGGSTGGSGSGGGLGGGGGGGGGGGSAGTLQSVSLTDVRNASKVSVVNKVTNDNQPILVGRALAGIVVSVNADDKSIGTVTSNASGNWTFHVSKALADGLHSFSAVPVGMSGSNAKHLTTTIDATPPTVTLTVPEFADAQVAPTVQVSVSNAPYGYLPKIHIDVDLNQDGKFTGKGETDYAVLTNGTTTLWNLPQGIYKIRARVLDFAGNVGSDTETMQVDPNAGFVADQNLLKLADGWYNTPYDNGNNIPGAWGLPPGSKPGATLGTGLTGPGSGGGLGMPSGGNPSLSGPTQDGRSPQDLFFIDDQNRVMIDARATLAKYTDDLKQELIDLGMQVTIVTPKSNMVTGYLPISQIMELNKLPHFTAATAELRPIIRTGSVQSEGDAIMLGPQFRAGENVDGTGIMVGVMSDSVNEYQGGLSDSVKTGDLPNNVQVLEDDPAGGGTDEGRAMLEIVHDVAPGSPLAFHTGDNGVMDFAQGILDLAAAGAKVITDDIGYFDEPLFSIGRMGQAVDQVFSQGDVYTTAGGNIGNMGWRDTWKPINTKVDSVSGTFQSFGGKALQPFTLAAGDSISAGFFWDAAYLEGGDPSPNFQVPQNMVAYVVDTVTGKIVATFNTNNQNTDEAYQDIEYTNNTNDSKLAFAFQLAKGPAPKMVGWVLQSVSGSAATDINALGEGASTLQGHTLAGGALTLGAVDWTTPTTPETFSSWGGNVQIFSDDSGVRYSSALLLTKPDVVAPDGIHTSFFGQSDGSGGFEFFGTSAAAPHAAAAAALLMQQGRGATGAEVDEHLRLTAQDLLTPGTDPQTGNGLIQLSPLLIFGSGNGSAPFEPNDTSDVAWDLGPIGPTAISLAAILGDSTTGPVDYDWYKFTASNSGAINVKLGNPNLELHLFTISNNYLTEVGNGTGVAAGSEVYVEVKGRPTGPGTYTQGRYDLAMKVS